MERRNLEKQLEKLIRKERALLEKPPIKLGKPILEKAPEPLVKALNQGFTKAFELLMERGSGLIGKTLPASSPAPNVGRVALAQWNLRAQGGVLGNQMLGAVDGTLLGVLGIGLPDIPVLLALLLKTIYQAAEDCGFSHDGPGERLFQIQLLCAAFGEGQQAVEDSAAADRTGWLLDQGRQVPGELAPWVRKASQLLALRLTAAKALQGLPVVGAAGGAANWWAIGRAGTLASLKYRKRALYRIQETSPIQKPSLR